MALIKFLIITIIVMWVIRKLVRFILPTFLRSIFSSAQEQQGSQQSNRQQKPEGSISVDYIPKKDKKGNIDRLGDFVEYEEVK